MLVLTRARGESVMIGDDVEIIVVDIRGDRARLGVVAPTHIPIHRKEVYEAIRRENMESARMQPSDLDGASAPGAVRTPGPAARSTPQNSPLFRSWKDPVSGVESFILAERVAPVQQSFYFTNPPFSADGRFLWLYCAFPPGGNSLWGRSLGVVDFEDGTVRHFPETQFGAASPMVDAGTGEVYWCSGPRIYRRGPRPVQQAVLVNRLPDNLVRQHRVISAATHLTMSADRRHLSVDAKIGPRWYAGAAPLNGSEVEIWQEFEVCHNHAQFNPTDADLMLLARDWWVDEATGMKTAHPRQRLWTLRRGGRAAPVFPQEDPNPRAHEWWSADGRHIWYVDYVNGTECVAADTAQRRTVWPGGTCHSHCDASGSLLVGDIGTYQWASGCRVSFYNARTGREVNIVTNMPPPPWPRETYHIDPHPQFCLNDRYIVYTTTVLGTVDVAVVPVEQLLEATA